VSFSSRPTRTRTLHSQTSISSRRPIMENGHLWENPGSRRASLPSASFDILRIACRHVKVRVRILIDRCCCVWRADDSSQGFSLVSLFGVAQFEPAPIAQHPTLLVVGKDYFVTGPLGRVLLPGYPGCPHSSHLEKLYCGMVVSWSINATTGSICPRRVCRSCPSQYPPFSVRRPGRDGVEEKLPPVALLNAHEMWRSKRGGEGLR